MNNDFPRMVYQSGGAEEIHGGRFATHIVHDADELADALAGGWHLTTSDAQARAVVPKPELAGKPVEDAHLMLDDDAPPTRDELKAKAAELGLTFAGNISTEKLAALVADALAGG